MKTRVLLAEDELYIRQAYQWGLERHGYQVIAAGNGIEALEQAIAEHPDIILLDMIMPRMHGLEVLKRLKDNPKTRHIPVLVLTNLSQQADESEIYRQGADDFIIKSDFSMKQVLERVEQLLSKANRAKRPPSSSARGHKKQK